MAKMEGSDVLSHASLLMIVLQACTAPIRLVHVRKQNVQQLTLGHMLPSSISSLTDHKNIPHPYPWTYIAVRGICHLERPGKILPNGSDRRHPYDMQSMPFCFIKMSI